MRLVVALAAACHFAAAFCFSSPQAPSAERVRDDYRKAKPVLESVVEAPLVLTIVENTVVDNIPEALKDKTPAKRGRLITIRRKGKQRRIDIEEPTSTGGKRVFSTVEGGQSTFTVETVDGLSSLISAGPNPKSRVINNSANLFLEGSYYVVSGDVREIILGSDYDFKVVSERKGEGKSLDDHQLVVEFHRKNRPAAGSPEAKRPLIDTGRLVLLPDRNMAVLSHSAHGTTGIDTVGAVEYGPTLVAGLTSVPSQVSYTVSLPKPANSPRSTSQWTLSGEVELAGNIDDSIFTLEAFGLGPKSVGAPYWIYFVIGVTLLGAAGGLRIWATQRQASRALA